MAIRDHHWDYLALASKEIEEEARTKGRALGILLSILVVTNVSCSEEISSQA
jgi:hypothetical protein